MDWKNLSNKTKGIAAIAVSLVTLAGAAFAIERYFAKSEQVVKINSVIEEHENTFATKAEVAALNNRITLNTLQDYARTLQTRIWELEDRYNKTQDPHIKRDLDNARDQLRRTLDKIDELQRGN